MKLIPTMHFQFMKDKELAKRLFGAGKPFRASVVPNLFDPSMKTEEGEEIWGRIHPVDNFYPDWAITIFTDNRTNPDVNWVQEGYRHCCGRCFNLREENKADRGKYFPDPHHEHVCLDGHSQSLERQIEVIRSGKKLLQSFGINPVEYCPPNHLYNQDTLKAAKSTGFSFFLTRNGFDYVLPGLVELPAYEDAGLLVIPESGSLKTKSPVIMTYYDRMSEGQSPCLQEFLSFSDPSQGMPSSLHKPRLRVWLSEELVYRSKVIRDSRRGVPGRH